MIDTIKEILIPEEEFTDNIYERLKKNFCVCIKKVLRF